MFYPSDINFNLLGHSINFDRWDSMMSFSTQSENKFLNITFEL